MGSRKQPKSELAAIYRLEFYKKQKSWKLAWDKKKDEKYKMDIEDTEKSRSAGPTSNTKIMNETYCIATIEDSKVSTLNDAFFCESETEAPACQVNLNIQQLHPISACEECIKTEMIPQTLDRPWADYLNDDSSHADDQPARGLCWDNCIDSGNMQMSAGEWEFKGLDDGWGDRLLWTNSEYSQGWMGDIQGPPDKMCVQAERLLCDQTVLWPDDQLWAPEIWDEEGFLERSLDGTEEFMAGARAAAHSSELEVDPGLADESELYEPCAGSVPPGEGPAPAPPHRGLDVLSVATRHAFMHWLNDVPPGAYLHGQLQSPRSLDNFGCGIFSTGAELLRTHFRAEGVVSMATLKLHENEFYDLRRRGAPLTTGRGRGRLASQGAPGAGRGRTGL